MVSRNLMEDACLPRTWCLQKFDKFHSRPFSTDLAYYILSPSLFQFIIHKYCGVFEYNVVELQSGAQIRVLHLLVVLIIILHLPVTAAADSIQFLTYWYCLVALLSSCRCCYDVVRTGWWWVGIWWGMPAYLVCSQKFDKFHSRPFSTDLPYYGLSPRASQPVV